MIGTEEQYVQLRIWVARNCHTFLTYLTPYNVAMNSGTKIRTIANFSIFADCYLWEHCQIEWVRKQLIDQYGEKGPLIQNSNSLWQL